MQLCNLSGYSFGIGRKWERRSPYFTRFHMIIAVSQHRFDSEKAHRSTQITPIILTHCALREMLGVGKSLIYLGQRLCSRWCDYPHQMWFDICAECVCVFNLSNFTKPLLWSPRQPQNACCTWQALRSREISEVRRVSLGYRLLQRCLSG